MNAPCTLKLSNDIEGDLKDGSIALDFVDWNMPVEAQPACSNPEDPLLEGKTVSGTLSVSKKYDSSSPALLKFLIKNGVIEEGIFTVECEEDLPMKIMIKDAVVTKIFLDSYDDGISERVHFAYGNIIFCQ